MELGGRFSGKPDFGGEAQSGAAPGATAERRVSCIHLRLTFVQSPEPTNDCVPRGRAWRRLERDGCKGLA